MELDIAQAEIDEVLNEKNQKLTKILDHMLQVNTSDYSYYLVTSEFTDAEMALLTILSWVDQVDKEPSYRIEYKKGDFDLLFWSKDDLLNKLDDRRRREFDDETFAKLHDFVMTRAYAEYNSAPLTTHLYDYMMELYRKLNIKKTMATTYYRIQEIKL